MVAIRSLLVLLLSAPCVAAGDKPNIVLLFADDLGRYASAYADPDAASPNDVIRTPVFDRIAKEGALATNAFVSAPSCSPCRASLISGRHFFRNGSHSQLHNPWHGSRSQDPWREVRGFALMLREAGYHVGWSHKMHIAADRMGGKRNNYRKAGGKVNQFSQVINRAVTRRADGTSAGQAVDAAKRRILGECKKNFVDFLNARQKGQPFYYSFHPTNTHRRWIKGSGKRFWGIDPDRLKGRMPPFLPDVPEVRQDLADYLGEAMAFDASCGVLIDVLRERGELESTLLVISGDHGAPGFPRGKTNCYDFGARVLFAARWPGRIRAQQRVEKPISLIDLAPTFLAAAGLAPESGMNGQDLLPALGSGDHQKLRGWALIGRETHVRGARGGLPYPTRAIRTSDFLYVVNFAPDRLPMGDPLAIAGAKPPTIDQLEKNTRIGYADVDAGPTKAWMVMHRSEPRWEKLFSLGFGRRPAEELYDLAKDPHQVENVAEQAGYATAKKRLREKLFAELRQNDDPRLRDDAFDRPPYNKRMR